MKHLDVMDGRHWLRLECYALARALRESGAPSNTAVRDAIAFRQARRMRYQGSAEKERALEINEGVASYTGVAAAAVTRGIEILTACDGDDSFVRTFAYWTGPAYGLLIDASSPAWRQRIRNTDDFAALLAGALAVQSAADAAASASRYGGAEIRAAEERRERERQERLAELRRQFVGRSGAPDSRRRQRQFEFHGRRGDSGRRHRVLRSLSLQYRVGDA